MAEGKTNQVQAADIPIVKAVSYRCENVHRVIVASMVKGDGNSPESSPMYALSFLRADPVPSGTAGTTVVSMEESLLATFVMEEGQARKLHKALGARLQGEK